MPTIASIGLAPIVLALGLVAPAPASAQEPGYGEGIRAAKWLILNGRAADARSLLQGLAVRHRDSNDVDFLLGMLAVDGREYDLAIRHFRAMLVRQPDAVRVRLELARAFYLKRDYDNAFRQFQFARAGRVPPGVAGTIDRFLAAIRREKNWSYNVSVAIAPDTNINNGTSSREVVLFGLPFELSDETRRQSGVGVAIDGAAEFAPRIGERMRLKLGGAVIRREYKGKEFDDTPFALYAGPRLTLDKWDLGATGTAFRRRFGGISLSEGFGAKLDATYYTDARTALSLTLSAQQVRYPHYPHQSGPAYSAWAGVIRALTPSSSLNGRLGVTRRIARAPELASWSQSISVGYYRDLPGGFSIYVEPGFSRFRYDAPDPFFGERRRDDLYELRFAILNRRILLSGFTPKVGFTWTGRKSNIDLYDYNQQRFEVGVTRAF